MVVVSIGGAVVYDKNGGRRGQLLKTFSFGALGAVDWVGNPSTAMLAIIIMSVWQGVGLQMVIFLAGLQEIPKQLYEADSINGANPLQQFFNVTLPGRRIVLVFVIIAITIAAFQLFTQMYVMTSGRTSGSTTTVVFDIVRLGFTLPDMCY